MFSIKLPKDLLHVQMNKKLYVWISNHNYHRWVNHVLHSVHLKDVHQRMNLIQVLFYKIGLPPRTLKLFYYLQLSIWMRILLLILPLEDDVNAMDMLRNVWSTGKKMISFLCFDHCNKSFSKQTLIFIFNICNDRQWTIVICKSSEEHVSWLDNCSITRIVILSVDQLRRFLLQCQWIDCVREEEEKNEAWENVLEQHLLVIFF